MSKRSAAEPAASRWRDNAERQREVEPAAAPRRTPTHQAPVCERCATSEFLVYERIVLVLDARGSQPPAWDVEYWCGRCESVYGMLTTYVPDDRVGVRLAAENPRVVGHSSLVSKTAGTSKATGTFHPHRATRMNGAPASLIAHPAAAGPGTVSPPRSTGTRA